MSPKVMQEILELTQSEYARRRGVTPKAIMKAIDAGRIPAAAVRREGRTVMIDVAAADLALPASRSRINTAENLADSSAAAATADLTQSSPAKAEAPGLTAARTTQAQYDARLKELEYGRQVGKLVEIEDVTRSMERCAEVMARDLSHLSARADDLVTAAARGGIVAVRKVLRQIEHEIRSTIAANMRLLGEAEESDAEAAEGKSELQFRNEKAGASVAAGELVAS